MSCTHRCFTPSLACVFSDGDGQHTCIRVNEVHSGLCSCRCGFKWDVDCLLVLEVT